MKIVSLLVVAVVACLASAAPTTQPTAHRDAFNLLASGQLAEARKAFSEIAKSNTKDAEAYFGLGTTLLQLGFDKDATYAMERARVLNPTDPATMHNLMVARLRIGDYEKAYTTMAAYSRNTTLDDSFLDLWITAGIKSEKWGDDLKAAIVASESAREGSRRWGVRWVTEDEYRKLESANVPMMQQRREYRQQLREAKSDLNRAKSKLENARNDQRAGARGDDERREQASRVSRYESECRELLRQCERLVSSIERLDARIIEPDVLTQFAPVLPQS